jgi:hypothetical protein
MKYIQCSTCYLLTMKDALHRCPDCNNLINLPRPDNYYKGSNTYPEITWNKGFILHKHRNKIIKERE